jgi:hypothetical protein
VWFREPWGFIAPKTMCESYPQLILIFLHNGGVDRDHSLTVDIDGNVNVFRRSEGAQR